MCNFFMVYQFPIQTASSTGIVTMTFMCYQLTTGVFFSLSSFQNWIKKLMSPQLD